MNYTALTLDSSILIEEGLTLDSELIIRLKQFKDSPTNIVMSTIILREIRQKLFDTLRSRRQKLNDVAKYSLKDGLIKEDEQATFVSIISGMKSADQCTDQRLVKFKNDYGVEEIGFAEVSFESVVDDYFDGIPPFADAGSKKHEFPDAIALRSLENWAKKNDQFLLCVSSDKDWHDFCASSDHLNCVDNLADALDQMQENSKEKRKKISAYLNSTSESLKVSLIDFLMEESFVLEGEFSEGQISAEGSIKDISFEELAENISEKNIRVLEETIETITIQVNLDASFEVIADLLYSTPSGHTLSSEWINENWDYEIPVEIVIKKGTDKFRNDTHEIESMRIPDSFVMEINDREHGDIFF